MNEKLRRKKLETQVVRNVKKIFAQFFFAELFARENDV